MFLFFPFRPRRFKVAKINRTIIITRARQYRKPSCVYRTGQVTYACTTVRVFALLRRQNINMYIILIVIYSVYIAIVVWRAYVCPIFLLSFHLSVELFPAPPPLLSLNSILDRRYSIISTIRSIIILFRVVPEKSITIIRCLSWPT